MNRGFVIVAQNTSAVNYVACAELLAYSIKQTMPDSSVALISNNKPTVNLFDYVIPLPYGDQEPRGSWKLSNDWQVYDASPYQYTIKLEADMFLPRSIDYWWDVLKQRELVVSTSIRNFKGELSDCRVYRKFIDDNDLPDVYNALTYFKKSPLAEEFFKIVKDIFDNWDKYISILKCNINEPVTTDWVYAIACHVLGVEKTTLPNFTDMSMVHMKQYVNELNSEEWHKELVYELLPDAMRINTFVQKYPFHYHRKDFAEQLRATYLWNIK